VAIPFSGKAGEIVEAVRRRAYELFEQRGCLEGGDLDDWLKAESEVLCFPRAEVKETAKGFSATITAPGFAADDIEVIALPREIVVEGRTERHTGASKRGGEQFLYCRFDLPATIRTEKVTATFDEGRLTIQAPRTQAVPVQAATA
jgi:HSP20 family molecular chaperone IbpA